jgi:uncharacterized protein with HEPN domain
MQQTLSKVKTLEKFIRKHGEDAFISQTIAKLLEYKLQEYDEKVKRLSKDLKKFERIYKKDSSVFFKEFKEGRLGDNMDFIEWSSLYQMRNRLLQEKTELESTK